VEQFGKEASQTRDYCVAKGTRRFARLRLDPSLRKKRLLKDDNLHHYPILGLFH
jgi:hypothetical protein